MTDYNRPVVLSVASFTDVQQMDGGDTLVVRFEAPDGRDLVMLVPRRAAWPCRRTLLTFLLSYFAVSTPNPES